jgi:actin-like ATPase involved in cell morphogenesis
MNEQEIAVLIRDAMSNFIAAREREGIAAYVAKRYYLMNQKQQEEKVQQVIVRIEVANKIRFLSQQIAEFVQPLLSKVTEDDLI